MTKALEQLSDEELQFFVNAKQNPESLNDEDLIRFVQLKNEIAPVASKPTPEPKPATPIPEPKPQGTTSSSATSLADLIPATKPTNPPNIPEYKTFQPFDNIENLPTPPSFRPDNSTIGPLDTPPTREDILGVPDLRTAKDIELNAGKTGLEGKLTSINNVLQLIAPGANTARLGGALTSLLAKPEDTGQTRGASFKQRLLTGQGPSGIQIQKGLSQATSGFVPEPPNEGFFSQVVADPLEHPIETLYDVIGLGKVKGGRQLSKTVPNTEEVLTKADNLQTKAIKTLELNPSPEVQTHLAATVDALNDPLVLKNVTQPTIDTAKKIAGVDLATNEAAPLLGGLSKATPEQLIAGPVSEVTAPRKVLEATKAYARKLLDPLRSYGSRIKSLGFEELGNAPIKILNEQRDLLGRSAVGYDDALYFAGIRSHKEIEAFKPVARALDNPKRVAQLTPKQQQLYKNIKRLEGVYATRARKAGVLTEEGVLSNYWPRIYDEKAKDKLLHWITNVRNERLLAKAGVKEGLYPNETQAVTAIRRWLANPRARRTSAEFKRILPSMDALEKMGAPLPRTDPNVFFEYMNNMSRRIAENTVLGVPEAGVFPLTKQAQKLALAKYGAGSKEVELVEKFITRMVQPLKVTRGVQNLKMLTSFILSPVTTVLQLGQAMDGAAITSTKGFIRAMSRGIGRKAFRKARLLGEIGIPSESELHKMLLLEAKQNSRLARLAEKHFKIAGIKIGDEYARSVVTNNAEDLIAKHLKLLRKSPTNKAARAFFDDFVKEGIFKIDMPGAIKRGRFLPREVRDMTRALNRDINFWFEFSELPAAFTSSPTNTLLFQFAPAAYRQSALMKKILINQATKNPWIAAKFILAQTAAGELYNVGRTVLGGENPLVDAQQRYANEKSQITPLSVTKQLARNFFLEGPGAGIAANVIENIGYGHPITGLFGGPVLSSGQRAEQTVGSLVKGNFSRAAEQGLGLPIPIPGASAVARPIRRKLRRDRLNERNTQKIPIPESLIPGL